MKLALYQSDARQSSSRFIRWIFDPVRWCARSQVWLFGGVVVLQMLLLLPVDWTLLLLSLLWIFLAGPYILWGEGRRLILFKLRQGDRDKRIELLRRFHISRNTLITAGIILTHLPEMVPFWISKPFLDHYANHLATEVPMLAPPPSLSAFCGVYYVHDITIHPNIIEMYIDARPVAYWPEQSGEWRNYTHLSGKWYAGILSERSFWW